MSPLYTSKISWGGNYKNLSYKQFLNATQNEKLLLWTRCLLWRWCALTTFCKGFSAMPYTRLLLTIYFYLYCYYCGEGTLIQTRLVQQRLSRYRFRAIWSRIWLIWKMPKFCFDALLFIQAILYIWKKYRQNTGNVDLLGRSNYYYNVFCQVYIILYINHLLIPHINVTNSKSTKVFSYFD